MSNRVRNGRQIEFETDGRLVAPPLRIFNFCGRRRRGGGPAEPPSESRRTAEAPAAAAAAAAAKIVI